MRNLIFITLFSLIVFFPGTPLTAAEVPSPAVFSAPEIQSLPPAGEVIRMISQELKQPEPDKSPSAHKAEEDWLKMTFTNTYCSRYMWRCQDLNDGNAIYQPTLDFQLGESGNSISIMGYYGLQGDRINDELDYQWTFERQLNPHISLSLNMVYYDIQHRPDDCYVEAFANVKWTDGPLKPAFSYYRELRDNGCDYYNLTLTHDFKSGNVPFSLGVSAGDYQGPLSPFTPGLTDVEFSLSSDFISTGGLTVSGKVAWDLTPANPEYPTNGTVWYSLGAGYAF